MSMPITFARLLPLVAAFCLALPVSAAVIADDPFTDNSHTNATGGDTLGMVYYRSVSGASAPLTVADDSTGIGTGKALYFSPTASQKILGYFTPVTLATTGESLRLSFDFRFTVTPVGGSESIRFGLFNSNGTQQTSEPGGTTRNDDKGYVMTMNAVTGGNFRVQKEETNAMPETPGTDDILGGTVYFSSINASQGSSVATGTTKHTFTLQFTRLAGGALEVRGQMDDLTPSVATIASASILTTTFDEFAFTTVADVRGPYFIDNLRITTNTPGETIALTSPAAGTDVTTPASLTLTAAASDADGITKVEFFNFGTKVAEALTPPYTATISNAAPGIYGLTAVMTDTGGYTTSSSVTYARVKSAAPDEYDALREKWRTILTGGDAFTVDSTLQARINTITSTANSNWSSMDKTVGRTTLWSDLNSTTNSAHISATYGRLWNMALALRTHTSTLENNATLRTDIISALDWMYANRYNENKTIYDNWWDWEIGSPQTLVDIVTLLFDSLTPSQIGSYMAATRKFTPTGVVSPVIAVTTGANRVWEVGVVAMRALLLKRSAEIAGARDGLSPVFDYVTSGDGFFEDGSFLQHGKHPYAGGYGSSLLDTLCPLLHLLADSTWQVTDPDAANLYRWVYESFEPVIYRGSMMEMVRGREISRSGSQDHGTGHIVLASVLRLAQFAPSAEATKLKKLAKSWIETDTYRNTLTSDSLVTILLAKEVLADTGLTAKPELVGHWTFPGMDRVVHRRPGFGLGVSMNSSRIYNYESINGENLQGWFTSDGSTWLYNDDLTQFTDFWPIVNRARIPGTTVDTLARANGLGQSTATTQTWTGGATLNNIYGAAGMELASYNVTLKARKSWFMFGDEIVALGSGITSTDGRTIETIIENRKLTSAGTNGFTLDGTAQSTASGWSTTKTGASWCYLEGTGGYYFPGGTTLKGLREDRTGSWSQVNTGGSATSMSRRFLTLWLDHGISPTNASYAYVLLPNKTASQTSTYAAAPQIEVVENSPEAHGVKKQALGICAVNFWTDTAHTTGIITSNKKASVLTKETATQLDLAVSDPTQVNTGTILVEIARSASAVTSADPAVTIQQLSPTIRASINVASSKGRTFSASLALTLPTISIVASVPNAAELNQMPGSFSISRTAPLHNAMSVPIQMSGTALSGSDYQAIASSVTFAENESVKTLTVTPTRDSVVEGSETVQLALQSGSDYTLGSPSSAVVTIADKPFDAWRFQYGLINSTPDADGDHDGTADLVEFALGSDPTDTGSTPSLVPSTLNGHLTLAYKYLHSSEIDYRVEVSSDLVNWYWGPAYIINHIQADGVTLIARDWSTTASPRFMRIKITRLP